MNDGPHPLDLNATLARMEPGIAPVDPMISLASLAISARAIHSEMSALHANLIEIRHAIRDNGAGFSTANSVLHTLSTKLSYLSTLADMKRQLETIVQHLGE